MPVTVVTSCSLRGWKEYGLRFVDTFHKFWPEKIALHIVSEDPLTIPNEIKKRREIVTWDLEASDPMAKLFYTRHKDNKKCRGQLPSASGARQAILMGHKYGVAPGQSTAYNFRYDAWKFSKKPFAIKLVADCMIGGGNKTHLIWVDADTVTFAPVPFEMLERMPPAEFALACLDRGIYHSECGWIGYNLAHPGAHRFITEFANLYYTDQVFALKEWHDSWVFDWHRRRTKVPSYHIPHKNSGHPFVFSELGTYMDHLKGARKTGGVSHDHPRFGGRVTSTRDKVQMDAKKRALDEKVEEASKKQEG